MAGTILGIVIVAVLVMVAIASLSVVRQLLRLKRRTTAMADHQVFVAVAAAQSDFTSLNASVAALSRQAAALKLAVEHVRESVGSLAGVRESISLGGLKSQVRDLLSVLR